MTLVRPQRSGITRIDIDGRSAEIWSGETMDFMRGGRHLNTFKVVLAVLHRPARTQALYCLEL